MSSAIEEILGSYDFGDPDGQALQVVLMGMVPGVVSKRNDPKGLGRVQVVVEALFEQGTDWLYPLMQNGGSPNRGKFDPPLVGAVVQVFFPLGSIESGVGFYLCGGWGKKEDIPTGAVVEGAKQRAVEEADSEWIISRDDRDGKQEYSIKGKTLGTEFHLGENIVLEPSSTGEGFLSDGATHKLVKGDVLADYFGNATTIGSIIGYLKILQQAIIANGGIVPLEPPELPNDLLSEEWKVK